MPCYSTDDYPYRNIHPYLHQVFDAFGPLRMFWGTDLTRLPCTYRQAVTDVHEICRSCPQRQGMGDGPRGLRLAGLAMTRGDNPAGWPAGRPLAVSVSVMLEGWAEGSAPGIGPMGNPLKPGVPDLQALSWAEYGPKVGAQRLLDLLDRDGVRAVFYTSGVVAERYPDLPAAIAARGHAVARRMAGARARCRLSHRRTPNARTSPAASMC